ncbi:MAG: hypothetical protein H6738_21990 [Alphaproteobacteria bacterium]|nr:hypothetical protein [Alphaproteobacteria bacterium]
MNRLTLALDTPDLERAWWRDWAERQAGFERVAVTALFASMVSFALLDRVAFAHTWRELFVLRAWMLLAMLPAIPAFFGTRDTLARWGQPALLWLAMVVFGSLWPIQRTIAFQATPDQLVLTVPALMIGLLALFGASGLRFALAAPVGVCTVLGFGVILWTTPSSTPVLLILAGGGAISGLLVGSVVAWSREAHARMDFVRRRELDRERRRSEALLRNLVPEVLARRLEAGPGPHLDRVEATVVFATVVGYDAERWSPLDAVALLDRVVAAIDGRAVAAGVERIKTVGATVLLVAGVPTPMDDHLERAAKLALQLLRVVDRIARTEPDLDLRLRVGLQTGVLVGGVVGRNRYAYDVWGDVVNTASRLDSHGEAGRIQVTAATAQRLAATGFTVAPRGEIDIKGKGRMATAWLEGA